MFVALAVIGLNVVNVAFASTDISPREKMSLDFGWKFYLGNPWDNVMNLAKAGNNDGPAKPDFADTDWRSVNLPHDWAVELPFDRTADVNHGFKPVGPGFRESVRRLAHPRILGLMAGGLFEHRRRVCVQPADTAAGRREPVNWMTLSATCCTCSKVSWGNMGSETISGATRSATGKSPAL